jgi:hypothetical protein
MSPRTPSTCHIFYSLEEADLVLRCTSPNGQFEHHISDGATRLNLLARAFRSVVALRSVANEQDRGVITYIQQFGRGLYEVFLKPVEDAIIDCNDLIIHHDRQMIPVELAFDGEEFCATRYGIGNFVQERLPPRTFTDLPRDDNILCIGLEGDVLSRAIYSKAPHAKYECITHTGSENVLDRIAANDYSIIHFGGHGIYDESDPGGGFLVLDPERAGQNKSAVLSIGDIGAAKPTLKGPFVFVNACYSGVIDDRYQGFVGFAAPLLERGASGCVVTLWSISDSSASKFASTFYREALDGMPVGQALRSARLRCWEEQRDILTSLAYVLFGDPNAVVTRVVDQERRT